VAESHSRVRSWGTVAAFSLIIALTVADGVDEGFSVWDWLIIAAGVVFILQALFRLREGR
jgi:MFS superfamily sulfate permease-like transporter